MPALLRTAVPAASASAEGQVGAAAGVAAAWAVVLKQRPYPPAAVRPAASCVAWPLQMQWARAWLLLVTVSLQQYLRLPKLHAAAVATLQDAQGTSSAA